MKNRYYDLNTYYRNHFGCRVQKISVDTGMTCPNRDGTLSTGGCIYCNERGSGTGAHTHGISVTEQLEQGKARLSRRYKAKKFIAYFQSFTNTYAPLDRLREIWEEAFSVPDVEGISVGTRPDCVAAPVLDLLGDYSRRGLVWIEYGLQSVHDATLTRINRGHDFRCFENAVEAARRQSLNICAHIILGLPGENREDMLETARVIGRMDIQGVKLHLLYVVKGTELARLHRQGSYQCLHQEEYADLVCRVLELLPPKMVIQRLHSDPHPEELVTPAWAMDKNKIRKLIQAQLEREDSWQGKLNKGIDLI